MRQGGDQKLAEPPPRVSCQPHTGPTAAEFLSATCRHPPGGGLQKVEGYTGEPGRPLSAMPHVGSSVGKTVRQRQVTVTAKSGNPDKAQEQASPKVEGV